MQRFETNGIPDDYPPVDPLAGVQKQLAELIASLARFDLSHIKNIPQDISVLLTKTHGEYELPLGMFVGELTHGVPSGKGTLTNRSDTRKWDCSVFGRSIEGDYVRIDTDGDCEVGSKVAGQNEGYYTFSTAYGIVLSGCNRDASNHGLQMCCYSGTTTFQWIDKMKSEGKCVFIDAAHGDTRYIPKNKGTKDGEVMVYLNH